MNKILMVENSQGEVFKIGDTIKSSKGSKIHIIEEFNKYPTFLGCKIKGFNLPFNIENITLHIEDIQDVAKNISDIADNIINRDFKVGDKVIVDKLFTETEKSTTFNNFNKIGIITRISPFNSGYKYNLTNIKFEDKIFSEPIYLEYISHYKEPIAKKIVEESNLEKAKRLYPIGTIVTNHNNNTPRTIKTYIRHGSIDSGLEDIYTNDGQIQIYSKCRDQWATIIDDFVLPEKWALKVDKDFDIEWLNKNSTYTNNYKPASWWTNQYMHFPHHNPSSHFNDLVVNGYTEITFEQFKKHVLKEE